MAGNTPLGSDSVHVCQSVLWNQQMSIYTCRRPVTASSGSQCSDSSSACTAAVAKPKPFVTAVKSQPGSGRREDWLSKGDYGRVPGYLVERQLQLAEQIAEEQVCNILSCCRGTVWRSCTPDFCPHTRGRLTCATCKREGAHMHCPAAASLNGCSGADAGSERGGMHS